MISGQDLTTLQWTVEETYSMSCKYLIIFLVSEFSNLVKLTNKLLSAQLCVQILKVKFTKQILQTFSKRQSGKCTIKKYFRFLFKHEKLISGVHKIPRSTSRFYFSDRFKLNEIQTRINSSVTIPYSHHLL